MAYQCSLCGKTGTVEGDKEKEMEALGVASKVYTELYLDKDRHAIRDFDLCEKCAKDFGVKNGNGFRIDQDHNVKTIEDILKN